MIVEAAFIFPLVFFVLVFLIYLGNAYYQKAKFDSYVTQYAIAGANLCADPFSSEITDSVPTDIESINPYRYLLNGKMNKISDKVNSSLQNKMKNSGILPGMVPVINKCECKFNNHILYYTFSLEVDYSIKLPLHFMGIQFDALRYKSRAEVPVSDVGEFIRDTDMAIDYVEQSELAQKGIEKIKDAMNKVKEFLK